MIGPGFVRTIVVIAIVYFGLKLLKRVVLPIVLKRFAKKMSDRMQDQMGQQFGGQPRDFEEKRKGEVTIEHNKKQKSNNSSTPDVGEYVDFEEVD